VLGLTAKEGRKAGAMFVSGHLVGDVLWGALALASILGVSVFGKGLFIVLAIVCGSYLMFLGFKAAFYPKETSEIQLKERDILKAGALFGVTNPKAYPVALAMFTSFVGAEALKLTLSDMPLIFIVSLFGFIIADIVLIFFAGLAPLRRFFLTNQILVTRIVGISFILFGLKILVETL
jgi:threonine/homoserine/homoserine lactone efflux protein